MDNKFCSSCGNKCMQTMRSCPTCGNKEFSDSPLDKLPKKAELGGDPIPTSGRNTHQTPQATPKTPVKDALVGVRGWLLFFVITLVIFTPLLVIYQTISGITEVRQIPDIGYYKQAAIGFYLVAAVIGIYSLYTGVQLWCINKGAVKNAKIFLIVQAVVSIIVGVVVIGIDPQGATLMLKPVVQSIVYGTIWYLFLCKSKRVQSTYTL